jgi:hypothetical protein
MNSYPPHFSQTFIDSTSTTERKTVELMQIDFPYVIAFALSKNGTIIYALSFNMTISL